MMNRNMPIQFNNQDILDYYKVRQKELENKFIDAINNNQNTLSSLVLEELKLCEKLLIKLNKINDKSNS